ncbi:hypothetical protein, partial [Streptomyces jumonjinensis]|uniref:hypothetical protein n=1 Tax=Streptomyces jumonjinensis TaxID=1945 RepID=UPI001E3713AC
MGRDARGDRAAGLGRYGRFPQWRNHWVVGADFGTLARNEILPDFDIRMTIRPRQLRAADAQVGGLPDLFEPLKRKSGHGAERPPSPCGERNLREILLDHSTRLFIFSDCPSESP